MASMRVIASSGLSAKSWRNLFSAERAVSALESLRSRS
jgi:hypothetical protein